MDHPPTATEVRTDGGYPLLKDDIEIVISQIESNKLCGIYGTDVKSLIQNDPRYAEILAFGVEVKNVPQKHLEHYLLTASATVDCNKVNMLDNNGSVNAQVPLTVANTPGFDLPETGAHGTWMFGLLGVLAMTGSLGSIIVISRKKNTSK